MNLSAAKTPSSLPSKIALRAALCVGLGAALPASGFAQGTVVSTRTLNAEVFDFTSTIASGEFSFNTGLDSVATSQGTPALVEIDLSIEFDISIRVTNNGSTSQAFFYSTPLAFLPNLGDCTPYGNLSPLSASTATVIPGGTGVFDIATTRSVNWTGSSFSPNCGGGDPWNWTAVNVWTSILDSAFRFSDSFGNSIPSSWIQGQLAQARVTGTVTVTWEPNALPSQVICAGSASPVVELGANGGFGSQDNVWLIQSGQPLSTNLLIEATQANSTVPATGLCVAGSIRRIPGSVSLGGEPFRLQNVPALSGSVTYFQSWFRTGAGTSATSECIGVTFP